MELSKLAMLLVAAVVVQAVAGESIRAEAPTTQPQSGEAARPQSLTVTVGDVSTRIDGPKMWTLSGIDYQGTVMAVEDSAYGTVLTIRGAGHLGTAHFLNVPGKPGAVEKENVTDLKFYLDDKLVKAISPTMTLSGKSFRMERKSTIRALHLESTVELRDNVLIETARFKTSQSIDLNTAHLLMYAWTPLATRFVYGDDDAIRKRGTFLTGPAETTREVEKSSRWVAVYEPVSGKGAVCHILKRPADADAWFLCVDAPGIYRKTAVQSFVEKIVPAGFEGAYQSAVGFFVATEAEWEKQAQKRAAELKVYAAKLERQGNHPPRAAKEMP